MSKDVAAKAKEAKPNIFKRMARFFKDLRSEFKKIVWPTKKTVIHNTGVVLIFMAIVAVAIWCLDTAFLGFFKWIF